jgi:hypothetical protein
VVTRRCRRRQLAPPQTQSCSSSHTAPS